MSRKYDLQVKEKHRNYCKEEHKKKYHSDEEYSCSKIKASLYYLNKMPKSAITAFLSVIVN